MFRMRLIATSINPNNIWVLLRILPTSPAKLQIRSMAEGIGSHQFVNSFHTSTPSTISKPISYSLCKTPLFENPNVFPRREISTRSNQQSFTVSYLVESLGLSAQSALLISKYVNFQNSEKPDKVINLFKKYGFTQNQMSRLFRKCPQLLVADTEKNILPKLKFFEAKGLSSLEIAKMLSELPSILKHSLTENIMPSYVYLWGLFRSGEKVIAVVKRNPGILSHNIEKYGSPNIDLLREHGVPDANIFTLARYFPRVFILWVDGLRKAVERVEYMGFDASNVNFVLAVNAFLSMTESNWESKFHIYKKWGWSEEDVLNAFRRHPSCMMISEDKLTAAMDFFINKMGVRPCLIAKNPILLSLSLKKILIPRFSVYQVLLSKGLVQRAVGLVHLFKVSDEQFLQKFVTPYEMEAPKLLSLYKEKLDLPNEASNLSQPYSTAMTMQRVRGILDEVVDTGGGLLTSTSSRVDRDRLGCGYVGWDDDFVVTAIVDGSSDNVCHVL